MTALTKQDGRAAQEELREIRRMRLAIGLDRERAARLSEQIGYATSKVRASGSRGSAEADVMGERIARLVDMEAEVFAKVVACEARISELERLVDALPGAQRMVLRLRYFEGYEWRDVAKTMHYTARRCLQMHEEALAALSPAARPSPPGPLPQSIVGGGGP